MLQVILDIKLTLEGPILTKSSMPGRYGIDASMAENHEGKYSIPGTLVKGRLRQSWEELKDLTSSSFITCSEINNLLGLKSGNSEDTDNTIPVTPSRATLKFSDFICKEEKQTRDLHRIKMDEEKGTVKKGALLIMETPFAPGEEAKFSGEISFFAEDKAEVDKIIGYIDKGLRWITSLGSDRTVGFGKFINVEIKEITPKGEVQIKDSQAEDGKLCLIITPKTPFCIAKRKIHSNLFESEIFIPGGVIKGTIASAWGQLLGKSIEDGIDEEFDDSWFDDSRKKLCKNFNKIRFYHAFPAKKCKLCRPVTPPLSLVKVDDKSYYDVVLYDKPVLINGLLLSVGLELKDDLDNNLVSCALKHEFAEKEITLSKDAVVLVEDAGNRWQINDGQKVYIIRKEKASKASEEVDQLNIYICKAPAFDIDWKDYSDVNKDFGQPDLPKELRVRTAIDKTKRKAEEDKLFAYEMIIPTGFHWLSWIDMGCVPEDERKAVEEQLRGLLAYGLNGLGKTKADACVNLKEPSHIKPVHGSKLEPIDGQYIVTLQTPAILCNPGKLNETSSKDDLSEAYKCVWNQISGSSLSLVRYFARQTLAGGYYLHKRFQKEKEYKPYLLTEAGSVFVLKFEDKDREKAKEKIEEWFKYGLPLPEWAKIEYKRNNKEGDHWSNCPYIRENGYSEIAVNLNIHKCKKPKMDAVEQPEEVVLCHSAECGE
jgi:CRISPR/Cas system CSM-associated protein Csm3 (group 7 of RAMP superfamily)